MKFKDEIPVDGNSVHLSVSEDSDNLNSRINLYGGLKVLDDVPLSSIIEDRFLWPSTDLKDLAKDLLKDIFSGQNWKIKTEFRKAFEKYSKATDYVSKNAINVIEFILDSYNLRSKGYYYGGNYEYMMERVAKDLDYLSNITFSNSYTKYGLPKMNSERHQYETSSKYSEICSDFYGNLGGNWSTFKKLRTFTAASGEGFLGFRDPLSEETRVEPVVMLTVKPELVGYVRKCIFLKEDVHPDALTLVVKKGFDHKSFPFKGLRSAYRKNILKPAKAAGIKIKEVDSIALTPITKEPKSDSRVLSIKEAAQKDSFIEFMEHASRKWNPNKSENFKLLL